MDPLSVPRLGTFVLEDSGVPVTRRLAGAPDLDGDGRDDVAVLDPEYSGAALEQGRVMFVLRATMDGWAAGEVLELSDGWDVQIVGEAELDQLAWVDVDFDIDGDGLSDLLLASEDNDENGGVPGIEDGAGKFYVFLGARMQSLMPGTSLSAAEADFMFLGQAGRDGGGALTAADFNNDGRDDLVIGSPNNASTITPYAGKVHVVFSPF